MALTRKLLAGMGIENAHIEAIIEAHAETVDALKAERDRFKEQAGEVPNLQAQLEEAKAGDARLTELQAKYDEQAQRLKDAEKATKDARSEFDAYKADVEQRETARATAKAYRKQVLEAAGISSKYLDDVMGVSKLDAIRIDGEGNVENVSELIDGVKEKFKAFVARKRTDAGTPETPPAPPTGTHQIAGAHERAVQINKEYRERMYGKPRSEE